MASTQPVSPAVQDYLATVEYAVSQIIDPATGRSVQIPDFSALCEAAAGLDSTPHATDFMFVIQALLGRAGCVDFQAPGSDDALSFPRDHHLHPSMGEEWYYVGCHMNVRDQNGKAGRLSVLLSMQRTRAIGLKAQRVAEWADTQATLATNVVNVVVDMGPGNRNIYRRNRNLQWPMKGGVVNFSVPGDDAFHFQCGSDTLSGPLDVLPLCVRVEDGDNMQLDLVLTNSMAFAVASSFFLQGVPISSGNGGTGFTPIPKPGIYYSWPQLVVSGSVKVGGNSYSVASGSGWIDHQVMMTSLQNPNNAIHPVPFVEDPAPYNAWIWQCYNLDNGQAFTGAGFIEGPMNDSPAINYGYYLVPKNGAWNAIYITTGASDLLCPNRFPAIVGRSGPGVPVVDIPIVWTYRKVENAQLGNPLAGVATPWYSDGTFNNANWTICAEFPADYTDMSGNYANGLGYMESVGFESVVAYRERALNYLKTGTMR